MQPKYSGARTGEKPFLRDVIFLGTLLRPRKMSSSSQCIGASDPQKGFLTCSRIQDYFSLAKPGILSASLFTTLVGFLLAHPKTIPLDLNRLLHTLFGTLLVAAGAGALNMLLEMETDSLMERTKQRPLPQMRISPVEAFAVGALSSSFGIVHLCSFINLTCGFLASLTLVLYLVFYTPLKEKTFFSIFVGAVSGSLPPLIGWTANRGLSPGALSLFVILFLWQFPHFLSLSRIYREDYRRANLKVILESDQDSALTAKISFFSALSLALASFLPIFYDLGGACYFLSALLLNSLLLLFAYRFYREKTIFAAKKIFFATIAYLPLLYSLLVLLPF